LTGKNEYCRLNIEYLRFAFGGINLKKDRARRFNKSAIPPGRKPLCPYGLEAKIQNLKLPQKADLTE